MLRMVAMTQYKPTLLRGHAQRAAAGDGGDGDGDHLRSQGSSPLHPLPPGLPGAETEVF